MKCFNVSMVEYVEGGFRSVSIHQYDHGVDVDGQSLLTWSRRYCTHQRVTFFRQLHSTYIHTYIHPSSTLPERDNNRFCTHASNPKILSAAGVQIFARAAPSFLESASSRPPGKSLLYQQTPLFSLSLFHLRSTLPNTFSWCSSCLKTAFFCFPGFGFDSPASTLFKGVSL